MKNKKLIYILLPLVILIWGIIFYRILNRSGSEQVEQVIKKTINVGTNLCKEDTISLFENYRDPFLATESTKSSSNNENTIERSVFNKTNIQQNNIEISIEFPDIKYFGYVTNQKDKKKIGLVKVKSKDFLMKEGEIYDDFKVVRIFEDSIIIYYKNKLKTFKK